MIIGKFDSVSFTNERRDSRVVLGHFQSNEKIVVKFIETVKKDTDVSVSIDDLLSRVHDKVKSRRNIDKQFFVCVRDGGLRWNGYSDNKRIFFKVNTNNELEVKYD